MEIDVFKRKNSFINVSDYSNPTIPFWVGKYIAHNDLEWQIENDIANDEWLKIMFIKSTNIKKIKLYFTGEQDFESLFIEKSYDNYESADITGWESLTNDMFTVNSNNQIILNITAEDLIYLRFRFKNVKSLNLLKAEILGDEYIGIDDIIKNFYFSKNQNLMPDIYSSSDVKLVFDTYIEKLQE